MTMIKTMVKAVLSSLLAHFSLNLASHGLSCPPPNTNREILYICFFSLFLFLRFRLFLLVSLFTSNFFSLSTSNNLSLCYSQFASLSRFISFFIFSFYISVFLSLTTSLRPERFIAVLWTICPCLSTDPVMSLYYFIFLLVFLFLSFI